MTPYYQSVVDLIATHPPPNGSLEQVLKLCVAVEAEHGERITLLTRRVVQDVNPRMSPPVLIPEAVFYETMARLLFMGEHADLELLLDWYERPISFATTHKERITQHWEGLFAFVTEPPPNLPEKELARWLRRIVTALKCVLSAHTEAVALEGPARPFLPTMGEPPPGSFGTATYGRPPRSTVLAGGVRKLVRAWMAAHQQLLDAAWEHLGSGGVDRGAELLALRERWLLALRQTFGSKRHRNSDSLARIAVTLANIRYGRSPRHTYLDAFPPYEARQFGFTPYDREPQDEPPGKSTWLVDLLRYRGAQLHFLLDAYGEYYLAGDPPGTTQAAREEQRRKATYAARRKLIEQVARQGGSLRLQSEDDLVSFGCALYQALLGRSAAQPSPEDRREAWGTLLELLALHLRTHTTHTEFNLDEQPSYFDRLMPRAINGGALMDCGVYAVTMGCVLLSWAHCVRTATSSVPAQLRFVMFPLHVGLIAQIDGFAPIVLHNAILVQLTDDRAKAVRQEWDASPEPDDPADPAALELKFLEDVAAQLYLRDVDMPLLSAPIGPVSVPPRKQEVWRAFRTRVVKPIGRLFSARVENPGRPEFQFDIRFLALLTLEKRWHDDVVVPFWNRGCFGLWQRYAQTRRTAADRKRYADELQALLEPVEQSYEKEIRPKKDELTQEFRANPALLGPQAKRITTSSRLKNFASSLGPVGQVREHLVAVRRATGPFPTPPFATEADQLSRTGA